MTTFGQYQFMLLDEQRQIHVNGLWQQFHVTVNLPIKPATSRSLVWPAYHATMPHQIDVETDRCVWSFHMANENLLCVFSGHSCCLVTRRCSRACSQCSRKIFTLWSWSIASVNCWRVLRWPKLSASQYSPSRSLTNCMCCAVFPWIQAGPRIQAGGLM